MNSLVLEALPYKFQLPKRIVLNNHDHCKILIHLQNVLKIQNKENQTLKVTLLNQGIFLGTICEIKTNQLNKTIESIQIELTEVLESHLPWIDVAIGYCRPQTIKKIFEHGSTLGINNFFFFRPQLYEKSYETSQVFETEEANQLLQLGLSQSACYYQLPKIIKTQKSLDQFLQSLPLNLESHSFDQKQTYSTIFVFDPRAEGTLSDFFRKQNSLPLEKKCLLVVGPERGFTQDEFHQISTLESHYPLKKVSLSRSILRVEHALFAAIHQLEMINLQNTQLHKNQSCK